MREFGSTPNRIEKSNAKTGTSQISRASYRALGPDRAPQRVALNAKVISRRPSIATAARRSRSSVADADRPFLSACRKSALLVRRSRRTVDDHPDLPSQIEGSSTKPTTSDDERYSAALLARGFFAGASGA